MKDKFRIFTVTKEEENSRFEALLTTLFKWTKRRHKINKFMLIIFDNLYVFFYFEIDLKRSFHLYFGSIFAKSTYYA